MHALNRVSTVTGYPVYRRWAVELAKTAYWKFTYGPSSGDRKRMYWKMSIDLSYPLVASMGHHDPLDGLITCCELCAGLAGDPETPEDLTREIGGLAAMCQGKDWTTDDPLGIGGLLFDAYRMAQMMVRESGVVAPATGGRRAPDGISAASSNPEPFQKADILSALLEACRAGLHIYANTGSVEAPAYYRLAFRELGLSIGLRALERLEQLVVKKPGVFDKAQSVAGQIAILMRYRALAEVIDRFWLDPANREAPTFTDHREINTVMLATSLAPDGYIMS